MATQAGWNLEFLHWSITFLEVNRNRPLATKIPTIRSSAEVGDARPEVEISETLTERRRKKTALEQTPRRGSWKPNCHLKDRINFYFHPDYCNKTVISTTGNKYCSKNDALHWSLWWYERILSRISTTYIKSQKLIRTFTFYNFNENIPF